MLTIIGVGHVFDLRARLGRLIAERMPRVVALELDPARYHALRHPGEGRRGSFIYGFLALVQQRIARGYGTTPGGEMLAAADAARECGASIALIDRDAHAVFASLRAIPFEEKVKMLVSALGGIFISKRAVDEELQRYHADEERFLQEFAVEYPALAELLVEDRNEHMARALRGLVDEHTSVVAVVGDGHVPGLARRIGDLAPEVIRLKDLLAREMSNASLGFTVSTTNLNP
ncbi:MAG: TraB/GumN family protein [Candidatus Thermoplasmatota archaeon]